MKIRAWKSLKTLIKLLLCCLVFLFSFYTATIISSFAIPLDWP